MADKPSCDEVPSLPHGKRRAKRGLNRATWRALKTLPLRERSLLRLLYHYGASEKEVAGALGISRGALRRTIQAAIDRATDPVQVAILSAWNRLEPNERRLAYLHRFLGLSLRDIARYGLVGALPQDGRSDGEVGLSALRKRMRKIERKARRARPKP